MAQGDAIADLNNKAPDSNWAGAFACLDTKKPASEETGFNTTRGNQTTTMNEILKGVENISDNFV